jgi:hypothetical protein
MNIPVFRMAFLPPCMLVKSLSAVHALQGFPSGPITIPGGNVCSFLESSAILFD